MKRPGSKSSNSQASISALHTRNIKPKASSFRSYIIIALVVLFAIGSVYSYFKFSKAFEFSTEQLFEQAFTDPVSSVTNLTGDRSKSMVGFDSWIRFKSSAEMHLRNAKEFKPYLSEVGRASFAERYEHDPALQQPPNNYEYLVRVEHGTGKVVNEALLFDKNSHEYFYRRSGM